METNESALLNPALYGRLRDIFGPPAISCRGEAEVKSEYTDAFGRHRTTFVTRGERYWVHCPTCHSSEKKLAISYTFGTPTIVDGKQQISTFGVKCYRRPCFETREAAFSFWSRLQLGGISLSPGKIAQATNTATMFRPISAPGLIWPLEMLPPNHPAVQYVRDKRHFDPSYLSQVWRVGYCAQVSDDRYPLMANRLYIPFYRDRVLVGFQGRRIDDSPKLRYYTARASEFPRQNFVYGVDQIPATHSFIVVTEGVADVWAIGPGTVCTLGTEISFGQATELKNRAAGRPIVLYFDEDFWRSGDDTKRSVRRRSLNKLLQAGCRVHPASPPPGLDPAETSGDLTKQILLTALRTGAITDVDVFEQSRAHC